MAGINMEFHSLDLIYLRRFFLRSPKMFARCTGMLMNNFAFGSRIETMKLLEAKMIIRNPGLLRTAIRVTKSHLREPISTQVSTIGSVARLRFSGWEEQETGKKTLRKRVASLAGRKGHMINRIPGKYRMRHAFITVSPFSDSTYGPPTKEHADFKVPRILRALARIDYAEPFMIVGYDKLPAGLYKFDEGKDAKGRRKLSLLQFFQPKKKQPKINKWRLSGVRNYMKSISLKREWGLVVDRALKQQGGLRRR